MTLGPRDVALGRLQFITMMEGLAEPLGLEAQGERRARTRTLSLPVHGHPVDTDPYGYGMRLRRQVRGYANNPLALYDGTYLRWSMDPEQNGWLRVTGAELSDGDGGVGFADFKLALSDAELLGGPRTHRPGRRLDLYDRRLSTVPRDFLGTILSTDFAAQTALAMSFLPVGAADLVGAARAPIAAPSSRASLRGAVPYLTGRTHGEVVTFEQPEANRHDGDVIILDRRGVTAPTYTLAGDTDPQGVYGWEELYGADQFAQPSTDVPVLDNGLCRVRWVPTTGTFAVDAYVAGTGFVEQGRVAVYRDAPAGTLARFTTLVTADVAEWTPEHGVARVVLSGPDQASRADVYVTVDRGWTGPRFEVYGRWSTAGKPGVALRVLPFTAGATTLGRSSGTNVIADGTAYGNFSALAPWAYLSPTAPNLGLHLAVLRTLVAVTGRDDTQAYGSSRKGIDACAPDATAIEGYVSVTLGVGPLASVAADATLLGQTNLIESRSVPVLATRS